jgi:hypothetical protein
MNFKVKKEIIVHLIETNPMSSHSKLICLTKHPKVAPSYKLPAHGL